MTDPIAELDTLLGSQAFHSDPYPIYESLRVQDPVHWSDSLNGWLLTRYDDVALGLRDFRKFVVSGRIQRFLSELAPELFERAEPLVTHFSKAITHLDPPEHTPIRRPAAEVFTTESMERWRPRIQSLCDDLLDALVDRGEMDLIQDFAFPLPAIVLGEVLGIPSEDRDRYKKWSDDIGVRLFGTGHATEANMEEARKSVLELYDYLRNLVEERRQRPCDDLISHFAKYTQPGPEGKAAWSEQELFSTCVTLVLAGHGTTTNLIGNGTLALLGHPDQLQRLRDDPSIAESAIEEILRFDNPLQRMWRRARVDVKLGGKQIRKGDIVLPALGAANRDPDVFKTPDELDLTRTTNKHASFGVGVHLCVGAPLARLQGQVVLPTLLRKLPGLKLATEELEWESNLLHRGLKALPVRW
jgi:cytochrome P450